MCVCLGLFAVFLQSRNWELAILVRSESFVVTKMLDRANLKGCLKVNNDFGFEVVRLSHCFPTERAVAPDEAAFSCLDYTVGFSERIAPMQ